MNSNIFDRFENKGFISGFYESFCESYCEERAKTARKEADAIAVRKLMNRFNLPEKTIREILEEAGLNPKT